MGYLGNGGTVDTSYVSSIANRISTTGPGGSFGDFDLATDSINSYDQGSQLSSYTVQTGDTLSSIAANLWGDTSLWYRLAEVNGLTAESVLAEGTQLIVPAGVMRNTNSAETFRPYDPNEILGNVAPTYAKPKTSNKCGVLGQVLMVVIAVVVTAWTAGALGATTFGFLGTTGSAIATGATAAATGSIASQTFGVATGIQDKFSWNAVAMAAIGGGVGGYLGTSRGDAVV